MRRLDDLDKKILAFWLALAALGLLCGLAGCAPAGLPLERCQPACVELGAGEVQPGLVLDFGACGRVTVTGVRRDGRGLVGVAVSGAPRALLMDDECGDGDSWASARPAARVSVCAAAGPAPCLAQEQQQQGGVP